MAFTSVLRIFKRLPVPPCLGQGARRDSGRACRAICSGVGNSMTTPATKLRFAPQMLRTLRRGNVSLRRLALRMKTKAFGPIGDRRVRKRRVRARCVSIGQGAVGGLVSRSNYTVTMNAASIHALRDLCRVKIALTSRPSTARRRLRIER